MMTITVTTRYADGNTGTEKYAQLGSAKSWCGARQTRTGQDGPKTSSHWPLSPTALMDKLAERAKAIAAPLSRAMNIAVGRRVGRQCGQGSGRVRVRASGLLVGQAHDD